MKKEAGVTLLNLMTAMAIVAVGLTLAIPNLGRMVSKNRFEGQVYDFMVSLNLARSEAIKRNLDVTMCPSSDGTSCAAAGNWNRGWILLDANGVLLQVYPQLAGTTSIVADTPAGYGTSITYTPSGRPLAPGALVLCYEDETNTLNLRAGRTITVDPTGRPLLTKNLYRDPGTATVTLITPFASCL